MSKRKTVVVSTEEVRASIENLIKSASSNALSAIKRKRLEGEINLLAGQLGELLRHLDPIAEPSVIFDPSNPQLVGRFIAIGLIAQPRTSLGSVPKTYGSGVYALYYKGSFPSYQPIAGSETPIYVGTTTPAIPNARTPFEQGPKLSGRLGRHAKNIGKATSTLDLQDFEFRSLVVQSGWEKQAEGYLIHLFRPVWNKEVQIISGFGKHGDSADTRTHGRSPWDTVHPARSWAGKSATDQKSESQIVDELATHFASHPPLPDVDAVLTEFFEELRQRV
jgi:hypothetical protein